VFGAPVPCDPADENQPVSEPTGHLQCPFCAAYEVERLFLASLRLDSCECLACGARWDEDAESGVYRGRASRTSAAIPRER
jgi:hypothetical protein